MIVVINKGKVISKKSLIPHDRFTISLDNIQMEVVNSSSDSGGLFIELEFGGKHNKKACKSLVWLSQNAIENLSMEDTSQFGKMVDVTRLIDKFKISIVLE